MEGTLTLYPYLHRGTWVFDDPRTGLKEEAFVMGTTEMISRLLAAKGIDDAARGFRLTFADRPFAGHDVRLTWLRGDRRTGNWYGGEVAGDRMEGWLCPALYSYFLQAPATIYVQVGSLPEGVDPIWIPPAGVITRRFVEAPWQPGRDG